VDKKAKTLFGSGLSGLGFLKLDIIYSSNLK